jgi:predicted regulator of Ras-like GTPase activity (Roadblock/LC7/MglB family)
MEDVLGPENLTDVLLSLNTTGGYLVTVLTDADGLVLASAPSPGWDADKQAAVVALIQRAVRQTQIVSLGMTDEISIRDVNGRRLICRPFEVDGKVLLLSVLADEGKPYRRLTNAAVRGVRRVWAI